MLTRPGASSLTTPGTLSPPCHLTSPTRPGRDENHCFPRIPCQLPSRSLQLALLGKNAVTEDVSRLCILRRLLSVSCARSGGTVQERVRFAPDARSFAELILQSRRPQTTAEALSCGKDQELRANTPPRIRTGGLLRSHRQGRRLALFRAAVSRPPRLVDESPHGVPVPRRRRRRVRLRRR